jgi:DNA mismatch repair protein MSH4
LKFFFQHRDSALSACAALFKHIEQKRRHVFTPNSIHLVIKQFNSEDTTLIDINTCRYLELIYNSRNVNKKRDLCSILNYTDNRNGMRKLRSNLLQPPTDPALIEYRLRMVGDLLKDRDLLGELKAITQTFQDLDEVIVFCQQMRNKTLVRDSEFASIKTTEFKIDRALVMKTMLKCVRQLAAYVESSELESLKHICQVYKI